MGRVEDGRGETAPFPKPSWKHRRRLIYATLALDAVVLIAIVIGWLFGLRGDVVLAIVASGVFIRSMFILAAYVFGAVVEDISLHKILGALKPQVDFGGFGNETYETDGDDDRRGNNTRRV